MDHINNLKMLSELKHRFSNRENIIRFLKNNTGSKMNSVSDILISYDLQAGSYIRGYYKDRSKRDLFAESLAKVLDDLGDISTLLEAGIGDGVSLGNVLQRMERKPNQIYGFDLSWSRVKYASVFLNQLSLNSNELELFTGDMFATPFMNRSMDVVFTVHAVEPNGGREQDALTELYRIARKYLVLLEPSYEFADDRAKQRMLSHGYVTNLYQTAKDLGYDVIEHKLFDVSLNPLNPTGLMVIRKREEDSVFQEKNVVSHLCCPLTKTPIRRMKSAYYSPESMLAYPIIDGIPCLLPQNAIVATHFMDFFQGEEDERYGI
ncbi:methyltransferase domain-containing protein [Paenibacillus sp. M1]|uniref:Methyltransferase domain-containing protein n=1 Tax=Paenibacillus haidiansis TaxID=1574488 RepID=A0ABU7VXH6_9BACL